MLVESFYYQEPPLYLLEHAATSFTMQLCLWDSGAEADCQPGWKWIMSHSVHCKYIYISYFNSKLLYYKMSMLVCLNSSDYVVYILFVFIRIFQKSGYLASYLLVNWFHPMHYKLIGTHSCEWQLHERRNAHKCWSNPIGMYLFSFYEYFLDKASFCAWISKCW